MPAKDGFFTFLDETNKDYYLVIYVQSGRNIPSDVFEFENIRTMIIENLETNQLPSDIQKLTKLRSIIIRNMPISQFPPEIIELSSLRSMVLENTKLRIPPEIIKTKNAKRILNYYFSQLSGEKKPINQAKALFVGQGSVGKTSLVRQILYGTLMRIKPKRREYL